MILKALRLKNIRSFIDDEIKFPSGSTLLSGDVGSGKSTVLLATDFALFGLRRGEIGGSDLLRHGENRGLVELEFSVDDNDVKITRTLKRSSTTVNQDSGSIVINNQRVECMPTELKARVLEMFGYPKELTKKSEIFRYTVYTPQEAMKQILFNADDRLSTLRKVFDIEKYGIIRGNTRLILTELRAMKRELAALASDIEIKIRERDGKAKRKTEKGLDLNKMDLAIKGVDQELEKKKAEMQGIEKSMDVLKKISSDISIKRSEISSNQDRVGRIETEFQELAKKIKIHETSLNEYGKIEKPKDIDVDSIIAKLEKDKQELLNSKAVLAEEIKKLKKILEKGVCDFCNQDVHDPASFKSSIDEKVHLDSDIDKKIEVVHTELNSAKKERERIKDYRIITERTKLAQDGIKDILSMKDRLDKEKGVIDSNITKLMDEIKLLEPKLAGAESLEKEYDGLKSDHDAIVKKKIEQERLKARIEQELYDLGKGIEQLEKEIAQKEEARKKASRLTDLVNWLDTDFVKLMELIEKRVMISIQKEFDSLFQKWFDIIMGDDLSVRINEELSPVIEQNNYETEYANLSGGEKTAVALAYRVALNSIINSLIETIKTKDLLILDEPTDGFSSEQLDRIRDVINELALNQILIVSHEPKIDTFVDNVIRFQKENHISRVVG